MKHIKLYEAKRASDAIPALVFNDLKQEVASFIERMVLKYEKKPYFLSKDKVRKIINEEASKATKK